MKKVGFLFILLLLFGIFSCKKAIKENPEYEGYWRGGETCDPAITIGGDGHGSFKYTDNQSDCQHGNREGRVTVFRNTLRVGIKKFTIDQEPTIIDTINLGYNNIPQQKSCMKMILDGIEYYKVIQ